MIITNLVSVIGKRQWSWTNLGGSIMGSMIFCDKSLKLYKNVSKFNANLPPNVSATPEFLSGYVSDEGHTQGHGVFPFGNSRAFPGIALP